MGSREPACRSRPSPGRPACWWHRSRQGRTVTAALGWRGHGNERIVDDPTVDMQTQLLDPSDAPMFTVQTSLPSYWTLTTLATFTGSMWTSSGTYRRFGAKLPGVPDLPPGTQSVRQGFQIQLLDSPWLPDAFDPISVRGGPAA